MQTTIDLKDTYIKPFKKSKFKENIDAITTYLMLLLMFGMMLLAFNVAFIQSDALEGLLDIEKPYVIIYVGFFGLLVFIRFICKSSSRYALSENDCLEMFKRLNGKKLKNNIALILRENEVITVGELRAIIFEMRSERNTLRENAYKEMIGEADISEKTKSLINDVNKDISLIEYYISQEKNRSK